MENRRDFEVEEAAFVVGDLISAGLLRRPQAPMAWGELVAWFKREHAPGLRSLHVSAALRVGLDRPPGSPDRPVDPAEVSGRPMAARLTAFTQRKPQNAKPEPALDQLPGDTAEVAASFCSLLDRVCLCRVARGFSGMGARAGRIARELAAADLAPEGSLARCARALYGPWGSRRAQRVVNRLLSTRSGLDRAAFFRLWTGGSMKRGLAKRVAADALRDEVRATLRELSPSEK